MKNKILTLMCIALLVVSSSGCSKSDNTISDTNLNSDNELRENDYIHDIAIQFGDGGKSYIIKMYDNDTARELARNIGNAGQNIPIYDYDNFEGYEYFQYYDIPTSYDIPSNIESITSVKAGELYYSEPNRVMLFYQDAEISGEYTRVGYIEDITGLKEAVEENPVLEGWGNKLVLLNYAN